jgi:hypothetical protein
MAAAEVADISSPIRTTSHTPPDPQQQPVHPTEGNHAQRVSGEEDGVYRGRRVEVVDDDEGVAADVSDTTPAESP